MANFDIKLTPESQKIIDNLAKAGKIDLRPTLNVIGIGYRKEVGAIFGKKQARGEGDKWAPLSDNPEGNGYASFKARKYPGAPLLVRTGTLRSSMTEEGASGNITLISKASATFGTSISYGIYHDSDEPRKSNLPRRNFSTPSERRMQIWLQQIEKDIVHNFEREGINVQGSIFE